MIEWEDQSVNGLRFLLSIGPVVGDRKNIFFVHGSFGDVYMQLAVIKEAAYGANSLSILLDGRYEILARCALGEFVQLVFVNCSAINSVFTKLNLLGRSPGLPTRLLPTLYPMITECLQAGILNYMPFLRKLVGSKINGGLSPININSFLESEAIDLIKAAGVPVGKTVLISADNNTHHELPESFWFEIIDVILSEGWTPCLNTSGTLTNAEARILSSAPLARIIVPPHLVNVIPEVLGFYLVGTNGFATIKALAGSCRGIHFINFLNLVENCVAEKSGALYSKDVLFHSRAFDGVITAMQTEIVIDRLPVIVSVLDELRTMLRA